MPFRKSRRNRNEFIPVKDRNPFFYLEHAKVEVDGDCLIFHQMNLDTKVPEVIPFPLATYQAVFFGLLAGHVVIAVSILRNLFFGLSGMLAKIPFISSRRRRISRAVISISEAAPERRPAADES